MSPLGYVGEGIQNLLVTLFNFADHHPRIAALVGIWLFCSFTFTNVIRAVYPSSRFAPDDRPTAARVLLATFSPWAKIGEVFFRKIGVETMPMIRGG